MIFTTKGATIAIRQLHSVRQKMELISFGTSVSAENSSNSQFNPDFQSTNVESLLTESRELLNQFTETRNRSELEPVLQSHSPLVFKYKVFQVLTPENFAWDDCIVSFYNDSTPISGVPGDITLVLHGHNRDEICCASTMCHVQGFTPVGNESPQFLKRWRDKWQSQSKK